jgi:hypothetical protein
LSQFFSDLIGDLQDEVWQLGAGQRAHEMEASGASDQQASTKAIVKAPQDHVEQKNAKFGAMKMKHDNIVLLFTVFVLGVVVGKGFLP